MRIKEKRAPTRSRKHTHAHKHIHSHSHTHLHTHTWLFPVKKLNLAIAKRISQNTGLLPMAEINNWFVDWAEICFGLSSSEVHQAINTSFEFLLSLKVKHIYSFECRILDTSSNVMVKKLRLSILFSLGTPRQWPYTRLRFDCFCFLFALCFFVVVRLYESIY